MHMHINKYINKYTHKYTHTYTHKYTHTYIHTYSSIFLHNLAFNCVKSLHCFLSFNIDDRKERLALSRALNIIENKSVSIENLQNYIDKMRRKTRSETEDDLDSVREKHHQKYSNVSLIFVFESFSLKNNFNAKDFIRILK